MDILTDTAAQVTHGYITEKDRYLARLKRIEGQARGIHRMVNEDAHRIDIGHQICAITSALENVALGLLDDHLKHCVAGSHPARRRRGRGKAQGSLRRHCQTRQILRRNVMGIIGRAVAIYTRHRTD